MISLDDIVCCQASYDKAIVDIQAEFNALSPDGIKYTGKPTPGTILEGVFYHEWIEKEKTLSTPKHQLLHEARVALELALEFNELAAAHYKTGTAKAKGDVFNSLSIRYITEAQELTERKTW